MYRLQRTHVLARRMFVFDHVENTEQIECKIKPSTHFVMDRVTPHHGTTLASRESPFGDTSPVIIHVSMVALVCGEVLNSAICSTLSP